jgi:SAM-dependent methyltransferase
VLDLGSGTGRNANYIAQLGNSVEGLEISSTAVRLAQERAKALGVDAHFQVADMGVAYPFTDQSFEIVIDVTSSNSLNEKERAIYLNEIMRVLKPGGYLFVKALCKDGDQNAKKLIKINPGKEYDTYINRDLGLVERVFSQEDFRTMYGQEFKILELVKKTSYTRFKG